MSYSNATRVIDASPAEVFELVAHIENFERCVPEIVKVEFLTEKRRGVGVRFIERRRMGKREQATELEFTEYVPDERVRIVCEAGGTLWDTTMTLAPLDGGARTELNMAMEAVAHNIFARVFNAFCRGFVSKAIERDMDAIKDYCERSD